MKKEQEKIDLDAVIRDHVNLEPTVLASMAMNDEFGNDRVLPGLGTLMRRCIELELLLRDQQHLEMRFKGPESARAWGFPDVATANFAVLWVWAGVQAYRYLSGQSYAPLFPAEHDVTDVLPPSNLRIAQMTTAELIDELCAAQYHANTALDEATPDTAPGTWVRGAIRSILHFDPAQISAGYYDTQEEFTAALATAPVALSRFGLIVFCREVICHYEVMRYRKTCQIRLRTETDAVEAELPSAHVANLITILAASLHADDKHRVEFLAPQERTEADYDALRAAARVLYRKYSIKKHRKFDNLVDANRHFGTTRKFKPSDRLLHSISRDVDPELKRMPIFVRGIEAGLGLPSMQLFRVAS